MRVTVMDVRPQLENRRYPVKAVVGEEFRVEARVFGDSRVVIGAAVIVEGPDGSERFRVPMQHIDNDYWEAWIHGDAVGSWAFRIETWEEPLATWARDAPVKIAADVDVEVTLAVGAELLERSGVSDPELTEASKPPAERLDHALRLADGSPTLRDHVGRTMKYPFFVDRERALFSSWYEMFPRSEGAIRLDDGRVQPGTLRTAAERLPAIAAMGFDIVYLPPIHPIGTTHRKGANNALTAGPNDPGSPWAIGSSEGGHEAVHPELGTLEDFDHFVEVARENDLEVALDLALQCSPDHPWVTEHPEWFAHRPDGTIAFAENPPKQYQDIYPLSFDTDPLGLYRAVRRVVEHWIGHGVTVFRVDNPHTKPLDFWSELLSDVRSVHPDVIFLAEAFTVPAMLHGLATIGFHQSYTYFTWRSEADELTDYLLEVAHETSDFMRPSFWVNTPDILSPYLRTGDRAMFVVRAVLAATGSPSWGMYAGYELLEHAALDDGSEEYLDSEKYEIKVRDWDDPASIAPVITTLNQLRKRHPALQRLRNLSVHETNHPDVLAYSRIEGPDVVLVVVDVHPGEPKTVRIDDPRLPRGLWADQLDATVSPLASVSLTPDAPARLLVPLR